MKILSVSVIACMLFCVLSCSKSNQETIAGKWQANDEAYKDWVFEFRTGSGSKNVGSVTFMLKDQKYDGASMTGNGSGVTASFGRPDQTSKSFIFVFAISGDELALTNTNFGGVQEFTPPLRFHRVK